jgi:hypothetical protein
MTTHNTSRRSPKSKWFSIPVAGSRLKRTLAAATVVLVASAAVMAGNSRIEEFTSTGAFVRTWGTPGSAGGNVYVADNGNNRISEFLIDRHV